MATSTPGRPGALAGSRTRARSLASEELASRASRALEMVPFAPVIRIVMTARLKSPTITVKISDDKIK